MISTSNNTVTFDDSITNFSRYYKNIFNKNIEDRTARFEYFVNTSSQDMLHYINPTLEDSEYDVAMIQVQQDLNISKTYNHRTCFII